MNKSPAIFFVSDRTGITAETLSNALLALFEDVPLERYTLADINSADKAHEAVTFINKKAAESGRRAVLFSTLPNRVHLAIIQQSNALCLDFLEHFIAPLGKELGLQINRSLEKTARPHASSKDYDVKIDAINFTLSHDDGVSSRLEEAELVLVGVSRSGKTPTCIYLAMQSGIRAANFPLTEEDLEKPELPASLLPFKEKLFGLQIDPVRIHQIRQERRPDSKYSSLQQCQWEVRQANALYKKHGIPYLDSTNKSIEEIARNIIREFKLNRHIW